MRETVSAPAVNAKTAGAVYLVGAGPGAADLLTLRAARLLEAADIVFYDALVNPEIVALAARAEKIAVGKRCGKHSTAQKFINKRLIDAAHKHKLVVRLKGGDPMLFGRAQEELDALAEAGVRCEVVPGITAALAASADAKISLTRRGVARSAAFVTPRVGIEQPDNQWLTSALAADTVAIYMGVGEAQAIASSLITGGKAADTPVMVISNASLPDSRRHTTTLAVMARQGLASSEGPALILVGEVYRQALTSQSGQAANEDSPEDLQLVPRRASSSSR
jgi:uroporphyrin-III C-methyltransferase